MPQQTDLFTSHNCMVRKKCGLLHYMKNKKVFSTGKEKFKEQKRQKCIKMHDHTNEADLHISINV